MDSKGLRVNMGKTKFMASGINLDVLRDSGKFPLLCAVLEWGMYLASFAQNVYIGSIGNARAKKP